MVDSKDKPILRLIPQGHHSDSSNHPITADHNISMYDGQPIGRIELVKSVLAYCKQERTHLSSNKRCPSCDVLCIQRYKFWSRNMFKVIGSKLNDSATIEINEKMTTWMRRNDQSISNTNSSNGIVCISIHDSDILSFQLPNNKQKKFSFMKFKVSYDKSTFQIHTNSNISEHKVFSVSSVLDENDSNEKSQGSSLSSSSMLHLPKIDIQNDDFYDSLPINHTMGISAESQINLQEGGISKRLISTMEIKDLESLQKYWDQCKNANDNDVLRKKFEFKSFLIDVLKVHHSNNVVDANLHSLFRKTIVKY